MKLLAALLLALPLSVLANPPTPVPPPKKNPRPQVQASPTAVSNPVAISGSNSTSFAGANSNSSAYVSTGAQAISGGNTVGLTASPELTFSTAQAPDVISYPTAPCRISVGGSAGWLGGAFGISGSTEDEGCTMRENARQLHNFGLKEAAIQLMCLDDNAKMALQATGTVCKISKPQAKQSAWKDTP